MSVEGLEQAGRPVTLSDENTQALLRHTEDPSLRPDEGGVLRVGKSRVSIDLLIEHYENGMTPEEMVRAYDSLALADVYGAIACYLRHRDELGTYLKRRRQEADSLRAKVEADHPRIAPEELLARSSLRQSNHAATGQ
jgi:uncharacterized protein (DUF433 family)